MTAHRTTSPQLLGFGGVLESGKDAAADHLVANFGFAKVNMSTPIDACLLAVNPIVYSVVEDFGYFGNLWRTIRGFHPEVINVRYREIREAIGYTEAKEIPEVRELLQHIGVEMGREIIDPNIWVNLARRAIDAYRSQGTPVCLSGVRFASEQDLIHELGGELVWIDRPGHHSAATKSTGSHSSEITFDQFDQDVIIVNDGTLDELHAKAEGLIR